MMLVNRSFIVKYGDGSCERVEAGSQITVGSGSAISEEVTCCLDGKMFLLEAGDRVAVVQRPSHPVLEALNDEPVDDDDEFKGGYDMDAEEDGYDVDEEEDEYDAVDEEDLIYFSTLLDELLRDVAKDFGFVVTPPPSTTNEIRKYWRIGPAGQVKYSVMIMSDDRITVSAGVTGDVYQLGTIPDLASIKAVRERLYEILVDLESKVKNERDRG